MRKTGIALSAFALAVTLGACGNDSGTQEPSAGSAKLVAMARTIGDQTSQAGSAHMKITAQAAGQDMSGEGNVRFSDADTAIAVDMTTSQGAMSMMYVDHALYVKLPKEAVAGKPWLKVDPKGDSAFSKLFGPLSEQLSKNADPRTALQEFEKAGEITATKDETLDGRKVTHHTITVDVQKMADNQSNETAKKAMQAAIAGGMTNFPVDVWVDEAGLPARFALRTPTPDGKGGMTSVTMRVDYSDWGKEVAIAAPPADQTAAPPA
jgi:hypothetical protein